MICRRKTARRGQKYDKNKSRRVCLQSPYQLGKPKSHHRSKEEAAVLGGALFPPGACGSPTLIPAGLRSRQKLGEGTEPSWARRRVDARLCGLSCPVDIVQPAPAIGEEKLGITNQPTNQITERGTVLKQARMVLISSTGAFFGWGVVPSVYANFFGEL